jgi:hypothetical protein
MRKRASYFPEWDQYAAGEVVRRPGAFPSRLKLFAVSTAIGDNWSINEDARTYRRADESA